jgi:predicted dienelactone hydrolase
LQQLADNLAEAWSADMSFVLDRLEQLNTSDPSGRFNGRLDMEHVGVFGHSLGGATALQFCHDDPRCKAAIDIDGIPWGSAVSDGVKQPTMFLMSDHTGDAADPMDRQILGNFAAIYDHLPADRRWQITIRGANHYLFSDDGAMLKSPVVMRVLRGLGIVHINGRRQIAVTEHFVSTFFDVYLKGAPAAELKSGAGYPEVEYRE